ncbi:MAG: SPOR domain-containing protein [Magnetococcus sp. YQC-3]
MPAVTQRNTENLSDRESAFLGAVEGVIVAVPPLPDSKPLKRTTQLNAQQNPLSVQQNPPQSPVAQLPSTAQVPAPEQPDGVATESTLRASGQLFVVQIGSFLNKSNAEQMARNLKQKGMESYVHLYQKEGKSWYSVRINHRDRPAAEKTATAASKETGRAAEVISLFYE